MNICIKELIDKKRQEDAAYEITRRARMKEWQKLDKIFALKIRPRMSHAMPKDYIAWLMGFCKKGGKPSHYCDYNMRDNIYVAQADLSIPSGYCGARAFDIIVPMNIHVEMGWGHGNLYYMDGFIHKGWIVPVYKNTIF